MTRRHTGSQHAKSVMSYLDPSLEWIARVETKVQGEKFGEHQTLSLFIAMRNSNARIDAAEGMPRVSPITQASDGLSYQTPGTEQKPLGLSR